MLGLLLFAVFILPFQMQAFVGYMNSYFFAQQTTEMSQRIREDGGFGTSAQKYQEVLASKGITFTIADEEGRAVMDAQGYTGKNLYVTYDRKIKFEYGADRKLDLNRTDIVFVAKRN